MGFEKLTAEHLFQLIGTVAYATPPERKSAAIDQLLTKSEVELIHLCVQLNGYPSLEDAVIGDALPDDYEYTIDQWGDETDNSELAHDIIYLCETAIGNIDDGEYGETASDDGDLYYYESRGC